MDQIVTINQVLRNYSDQCPEKIGLQFQDKRYSYGEINRIVNKLAQAFLELGVVKGDRVAILLPNSPEFLFSWFAASKIGAIEVPINTGYKGEFLSYILNNSEAKILVTEQSFLERIAEIITQLTNLEQIIVCKVDPEVQISHEAFQSLVPFVSCHEKEQLLSDSIAKEPDVHVDPTDLAAFIYTSGTTGPSKGVMLTHQYFYYMANDNLKHRDANNEDIFYTCLPLFHGNAQGLTTLPAFFGQIPLALGKRFSASLFWDEIRYHKATQINLIGAMLSILMKQPPSPNDRDNPVRLAFVAPIPKELFHPAQERWNLRLLEGFGLTESGIVAYQPKDRPKPGSFGKALPDYEVKIVDEHDRELPPNTIGEIITRPKRPHSMMEGYYKMPEKTLEAFKNLWFHTGDLGMKDEEGYLYFVDRKKDAIRRRGENISSFELERVINSHPDVYESAAIGVPSDLGEDDVKVYIVFKKEVEPKPYEEMLSWMKEKLPSFMVPRYLEYVESLPKTPTERVEKYKLRQNALNPNTWDSYGTK